MRWSTQKPHRTTGPGDRRSGEVDTGEDARRDRGLASPAGNCSSRGGDDRGRAGRSIAIHAGSTIMGYGGIVASEHSSGESTRRGGITKTGNAHLRRVVVEAAWAYRHRPNVGGALRQRQDVVSEEIREIAWKAQHRLHTRYRKLTARGKDEGKVVTAIGRELLGFIWAIGVNAEARQKESERRAA